jgi:hypothetical protein
MELVRGLVFSVLVCGCGPAAGEAVRPPDTPATGATAAGVTNAGKPAACHQVGREGTPFVVDWKPEQRAELEAAMRQGVVVVHYDCDGLKVLPECKAEGDYTFAGTSPREQAISLSNADEVKANLPATGGQLGASIDIGLTTIGKSTTKVRELEESDLKGSCQGATHFVTSVYQGAFKMGAQSAGEAEACKKSDLDAPSPPPTCRVPLELHVHALGGKPFDPSGNEIECANGLTAVKGKCAAPEANAPKECDPDDQRDCKKRCEAGNVMSCFIYANHGPVETRERIAALQRACDLGDATACGAAGDALLTDVEPTADDKTKAVEVLGRVCNAGRGDACETLGAAYATGPLPVDKTKAARYLRRSCNLAWAGGCEKLGDLQKDADAAGALAAYKMGCTARDVASCDKAADALESGKPADPDAAKKLRQRACQIDPDACKANGKSAGGKKGRRRKK